MHETTTAVVKQMGLIDLKTIPLSGVKGVLLDLDDTLYAYDPCHKLAYEAAKELAKVKYGIENELFDIHWKKGRDKVHHDLHGQGASHSRLLYVQKLYESVNLKTSPQFSLDLEEAYWRTFLNNMRFAPGVEEFLKTLKSLGIATCIVTDLTAQIQMRKWIKLDLGRYIDFLVTSEEAGVEKPSALIFKLACEKTKLQPSEVIMIGDNFDKDVKGLEDLGIKAYWVSAKTESNT